MLQMFRRLQGRMTLSYILVTIPAMVLLQACFFGLLLTAFRAWINSEALADDQARALAAVAPQVVPYLPGDPTGRDELTPWLQRASCSGTATIFPDDTHPAVLRSTIVDAEGRVVGAALPEQARGAPLAPHLPAPAREVLQAALSGQGQPARLARRLPDHSIVAAAPIRDAEQRLIGAWVTHIGAERFFTREESAFLLALFLFPVSLLAALFAILLGAIYGAMTSRHLVRRLGQLVAAAEAWSGGDFRAVAEDRTPDELGMLSRQLNHMAEQLQGLVTTRQELAILEERQRLSRDLHDSVKQQLFAISMHLASAQSLLPESAAPARFVALADALTVSAQRELMSTIHALRADALDHGGLVGAVQRHLAAWSEQHGIAATLQSDDAFPLPLAAEHALFRVAQEALTNSARHSGATQVTVRLVATATAVSLAVRDDGRGFDPDAVGPTGLGIQSMRERLAACGGTLTIRSQVGAGTELRATLPLTTEHSHG